jgi:dTDP-4-amino-4,6-dideoxygalactose transaminase
MTPKQLDRTLARIPEATAAVSTSGSEVPFPFLDLKAQYASVKNQIMPALVRVMESQHFILGKEVEAFEKEIAAFLGVPAAVSCASGSDALLLSLLAVGVGVGDEVVIPPFTFVATAGAVARVGAKPVFVDIQRETFNIDPGMIEAAITDRTRAIIPVHLFGLPADLNPILSVAKKQQLAVIEDAAQAIGSRYHGAQAGTLGTFGCFSFFPSKNLGGAGDGGLVVTNDARLEDRVRLLRVHGSRRKYHAEIVGTNSRLDALQAAILRVKLTYLEEWTLRRQSRAERYRALFAEYGLDRQLRLPSKPAGHVHVYNQFVLRCPERDRLREYLRLRGIPSEIYYPVPLHLQPAFAYLGYSKGQFPESEAASREVLALPIYPELSEQRQVAVVRAIAEFYKGSS